MRKTLSFFLIVLTLVAMATLTSPAAAAPSDTAVSTEAHADGAAPGVITDTRKCRVVDVRENRLLTLYDIKTEKKMTVLLGEDVKIEARSKKQFGKKKLEFAHLAKGQNVKVNIRTDTGQITKVTIQPVKKS